MMRPGAFENYGAPVESEVRAEIDLAVVEPPVRMTPEPVDEPEYENTAIFIEPSLLAACGMSQPTAYFALDSAKLSMATDPMINVLVNCMDEYPLDDARLTITGHADPRGPEEYNRELGLDRANALARKLVEYGLNEDRIDTYSWGEAKASDDPEDWNTDRRVVIRLDK